MEGGVVGICPLRNPIREYAWGSRSAIAELLGQPAPSPRPQAEIWMGGHPSDPSRARCRGGWVSLSDLLRENPVGILGESTADRFDGELPFLFKILAAARPLSIQAHPDREQARAGFERENAAGIDLGARERNYPDPHPKHELICALSPFSALCGFRPVSEIVRALRDLELDEFAAEIDSLDREGDSQALEGLFSAVWNASGDRLKRAIDRAVKNAERRSDDPAARWMTAIASLYPGDAGVLAPLFLNLVRLAPGEGIYLGAGKLHSYLEGVGIEIMGNSDNVIRGGLTTKHVDIPELCRVLCFEPGEPEILLPREASPGERIFEAPVDEFELAVISVAADKPWNSQRSRGVEILLSIEGVVKVVDRAAGESFNLEHGASVLIPNSVDCYELVGEGVVYRAGVPRGSR